MIRISPIAEDWAVKGFHLHVNGIEIAMIALRKLGID
jgi:hypothetical protein